MPALKEDTKLWIAHPKLTSKIATNLNRLSSWQKLTDAGFESCEQVSLDHVWHASQYKRLDEPAIEYELAETETIDYTISKKKKIS